MRDIQVYAQSRFTDDTKDHELQVLHDDGLYRHLRFKQPGTTTYYFDLVTWPGHLGIYGDAGDFVFARTQDMIEFFLHDRPGDLRINPHYWAGKLVAPRPDGAMEFSAEEYERHVLEMIDDVCGDDEYGGRLREAIRHELLVSPLDGHEAHQLLQDFEHEGWRIGDSWEWDLRDYRFQFLWCCWAIVWGLSVYRGGGANA